MKKILCFAVIFLFPPPTVFAALIEAWRDVNLGMNSGTFADNLGSKIEFVTEAGLNGSRALRLTSKMVQGGWCGIWRSTSGDLSRYKSLKFRVRTSVPGEVKIALMDAYQMQYVASFSVSSKDWKEVTVPFSSFKKDPYYTPPGAIPGHPMDLSQAQNMNFQPMIVGESVVEIGPVEAVGTATPSAAPATGVPSAGSLIYKVEANGEVLFNAGLHNVGFVMPEMFTEGWKYNSFNAAEGGGEFTGQADLGSGETVILKTVVEDLPRGLRIHYTLLPKKMVQALQIRGSVYLNYPQWEQTPYRLGSDSGEVPIYRLGRGDWIAQADGRPLSLGPSPTLGGLQIQLIPGTAHLYLADNRHWNSNLVAFVTDNVTHDQPTDKPWTWNAGQEKHVDFDLVFNRDLSPAPTSTPVYNYGMDSQNSTLFPANNSHIQYSGRFDFSNPLAPRFDWPAVSISAVFRGTAIGILLDDGNNDYNAFIDGKLRQVIVTGVVDQYTVGGLEPGIHTLVLVKRTEASFGIATFKGLLLQKGMTLLKPPPLPSRRIEIVGDSLACGAEDEDPDRSCESSHFRPSENAYLAYGPLAARALGADYRITSYSGTGILKKFGEANLPMPAYYPRVLAGLEAPVIYPKKWAPDAVVIELGNNDMFSSGTLPTSSEFVEAYKKFISVLRADYPKAHLFCMTFGTSPPVGNLVQDVVAQENKAGDDKVGLIEVDYPSSHVTGCYQHFDLVGQQRVADELAQAVGEDMGWRKAESKPKVAGDEIPPPP